MKRAIFIAVVLVFCSMDLVIAGGPIFVDKLSSGMPYKWADGTLKWYADPGDLNSKVPGSTGIRWVTDLFNRWENAELPLGTKSIHVANIHTQYLGNLAVDVKEDNYMNLVVRGDGAAVVVFDRNGLIIDDVLGTGNRRFVVGFATPFVVGNSGDPYFDGGVVVLNGLFTDNDLENGEVSVNEFKAAILHEIGHLLNLDHTQANYEAAERFENNDNSLEDDIPTMYPILYSENQIQFAPDDVIALAEQYPSDDYLNDFCRITGNIADQNGSGVQGADVIARAVDPVEEWFDVRTYVSGVAYPKGTANGDFVLGGLVPGRKYNIAYREILPKFKDGSSIEPYDPPRTDIGSGAITEAPVSCEAGKSIALTRKTVNISSGQIITLQEDQNKAQPAAPSGGCSLIR